jgi:predicted RNA methylase
MDGMLSLDFDGPQASSAAGPSTGIVPRATVRDMVKRRQIALDTFAAYYQTLARASEASDVAFAAFHAISGLNGRENRYNAHGKEEQAHFLNGFKVTSPADFTSTARKMVDRRMWATLIELTDLERLMDKKAKDELQKNLDGDNVPEATEENIFATLQTFVADADTIFKRGIANCFSSLDRRFRSHDGWKIGSRVVLTYAFDNWGSWNYRQNQRDTLHDIDRTFAILDGKENPHMTNGIVAALEASRRGGGLSPRQSECESEYFIVRGFKNGNAHVWFKRDDLVEKVNKLLGEYYGAVIPDDHDEGDKAGLHTPKTSLAKNYGFFPTPDMAADLLFEYVPLYREKGAEPVTVLEPSAGTGNLARRAADKGAVVDCIEYQPALAEQLKQGRRYRRVLTGDFLLAQPDRLYDVVVMNPPFDRERDIDHVMHALKFLKPAGCLVAIMSAGTEFRETRKSTAFRAHIESMGGKFRDLPAGSFSESGTNVNTVMLRVWNDKRHTYGF